MKRIRVSVGGEIVAEVDAAAEVVIGRKAPADIVIADGQISTRHLRITPAADGHVACDLGSTNGSVMDGESPLEPDVEVPFARGQKLTVGPATVELVDAPAESSTMASSSYDEKTILVDGGGKQADLVNIARFKAAQPRLVIAAEHDRRVVPLEEMEVVVGRDKKSCAIVIKHQSISGKHASFAFGNGRFVLKDLESSNGTFLDGHPVSAPTPLPNQAAVTIGTVECLYVQNSPESGQDLALAEKLVDHTVAGGKVTASQGKQILAEHRSSGRQLGEMFVECGAMTPLEWSEVYRQRQVIATLSSSPRSSGGSPWLWMLFALMGITIGAIAVVVSMAGD